jgi:hypothetical protein
MHTGWYDPPVHSSVCRLVVFVECLIAHDTLLRLAPLVEWSRPARSWSKIAICLPDAVTPRI